MLAEDELKLENARLTDLEALIFGRLPDAEARELLLALTPDRVTPALLTRLVEIMSATCIPLPTLDVDVMDCCGTGGSGLPHYNTSSTVAFVLAAGGVKVVKFGNRAASSRSGSFDFLEAIGIPAETHPDKMPELLDTCGLVFLYAPQCYPALGPLATLRKSVSTRTVFNFLGPLLHPMEPAYRLLGVSHSGMQRLMADYLAAHRPPKSAWLVHSPVNTESGLDEIAAHGLTHVLSITGTQVEARQLTHEYPQNTLPESTHSTADNLAIFNRLIQGEDTQSIYHRMVCLNAGAGFYIAGKATSIGEGVRQAEALLTNGQVRETVAQCRRGYGH